MELFFSRHSFAFRYIDEESLCRTFLAYYGFFHKVTILGRYLYLETLIAKDPAARLRVSVLFADRSLHSRLIQASLMQIPLEVALSQDTQKRYLAYSEYLLNFGLPELVAHVQSIAQQVLSG